MGKPSTPPPPDYRAAAEETSAGNVALVEAQTEANRPDQFTPWGSSTWEQDAEGNWTQNISLNPDQQSALSSQFRVGEQRSDLAEGMFGRVGEEFGQPMDWGQFDAYQKDLGTGDEARQQAIDEMYGQATSRLDPQWEQSTENQLAMLRNQGLRPGDEAFDNAVERLENQKTDAYNQAMFSSIRHGGAEGSRVFGMNRESAGFENTVRQAEISEEMQRRGFSLNEINAILSGQQIGMPGMPSFTTAGRAQGPDYTGAARDTYSGQMDQFNADQAWRNSMMSGAGSAMMFSDIRLKRNVRRIGSYHGHKIYSWTYIWGEHATGVMAHEMPLEYLARHESGYLMVDYRRI